jgi:hypothetical protein
MESMIQICLENKITTLIMPIFMALMTESDFGKAFASAKSQEKNSTNF